MSYDVTNIYDVHIGSVMSGTFMLRLLGRHITNVTNAIHLGTGLLTQQNIVTYQEEGCSLQPEKEKPALLDLITGERAVVEDTTG